jgi:hypothetical protein
MPGETSVMPGDRGTVTSIGNGPGFTQYMMKWDNDSTLALIEDESGPTQDKWMYESDYEMRFKKRKSNLKESDNKSPQQKNMEHLMNNINVFRLFDRKFLFEYLEKVRESGIVNMFGAAPFLYMGSDRIESEHKYNENKDEDAFEQVVEMADEAKDKMIQGAMKVLEKEGKELDINRLSRLVQTYSKKVLDMFITTYH